MDSRPDARARANVRTVLVACAAAALSAAAVWFGSGLRPIWWMAWLAPIPMLWLAMRSGWRTWVPATLVAFALGSLNLWAYLHDRLHLPANVIVQLIVLPAVVATLLVAIFRAWMRRGQPLRAALATAATATAIAFASAAASPHGTWGDIAYTQMDALPVIQVAALTGLWGIGFVMWWVASCVVAALAPAASRNARMRAGIGAVAMLVAMLGFAAWRLVADTPVAEARVGLLAVDGPIRADVGTPEGAALLQRYVAGIEHLADAGATVVVMPETVFASSSTRIAPLADVARQRNVRLVAGVDHRSAPGEEQNMAVAQVADTTFAYAKQHLLPVLEGQYRPGNATLHLPGTPRMALAVCKDLDFSQIGRDNAGTQLLLAPAWDFGVDGWLHARMAMLRGVENGFALARTARDGRMTLSDDRGRVLLDASAAGDVASAIGTLPLHSTRTLYARWGDWFAWACVAASVSLLAALLVRRGVAIR